MKYVPHSVQYTLARAHCREEGGDLIKIDTTLKYDIFKEILSKNPGDCDYLPQFFHDCLVKRLLIQLQRNRNVVVLNMY